MGDFKCKPALHILNMRLQSVKIQMGSSTEIVAFQVCEILKTYHEFLQFF